MTRTLVVILLLAFVNWPSAMPHGEPDRDAVAIVDNAINAHGGETTLEKLKVGQIKSHFKGKFGGMDCEMNVVDTFQSPDQFRKDMKGRMNRKDFTMSWAINGKKTWIKTDDGRVTESDTMTPGADKQFHPLAFLAGLKELKDSMSLARIKETELRGKKVVGVKVKTGEEESLIYFDKESSLLYLLQQRRRLPDYDNKPVLIECLYHDYKDLRGLKLPMRHQVSHDGQPYLEINISEVSLSEKLDANAFSKP